MKPNILELGQGHVGLASTSPLITLDDAEETALFAELVHLAVSTLGARSVLDVGCGCGIPTMAAARAGASRVVGIDIMECNVELTRKNIRRAGLGQRITAHHASWEDVCEGRLQLGPVDLVVANPPYVPAGHGVVVDGGPTGTRLLEAIIAGTPREARGIALLFGSLCDPHIVLKALSRGGFAACELLVHSVHFGRYTSEPRTLARLRELRTEQRAWFCDLDEPAQPGQTAPHAYLTLGVVARRMPIEPARQQDVLDTLMSLLSDYQMQGPSVVPEGPSLLALPGSGALARQTA